MRNTTTFRWNLLAGLICLCVIQLTAQKNEVHIRNCTEKIISVKSYNAWDNSLTLPYQFGNSSELLPQIHGILAQNPGTGETCTLECASKYLFKNYNSCKVKFSGATGYNVPEVVQTLEAGNWVYFSSTRIEKGDKCYMIGFEDYEQFLTKDIRTGTELHANNGAVKLIKVLQFELWFQTTGNLELHDISITSGSNVVWSSNTAGHPNAMLAFQSDGNVVIYDGGNPIWYTSTADSQKGGKGGVKMLLNGAGHVQILNVDSQVIWQGH